MASHAGLMSLPLESQKPRASSLASMGKSPAFLHQSVDSGAASPSLSIPSCRMGWCAPCLAGRDRSEYSSCSQMPDLEGGWALSGAGPPPLLALKGPQIPSHRWRSTLDPLLVGPHPGLVNALKAAASGRVDLCPSVEDSPPLISFLQVPGSPPCPGLQAQGVPRPAASPHQISMPHPGETSGVGGENSGDGGPPSNAVKHVPPPGSGRFPCKPLLSLEAETAPCFCPGAGGAPPRRACLCPLPSWPSPHVCLQIRSFLNSDSLIYTSSFPALEASLAHHK